MVKLAMVLLKNKRRKDGDYEKQNQTDYSCVFLLW